MFLIRNKNGNRQVRFEGKYSISSYYTPVNGIAIGKTWLQIEGASQFAEYESLEEAKAEVEYIMKRFDDCLAHDVILDVYVIGEQKKTLDELMKEKMYE